MKPKLWVVIPVKPLRDSKTRLAGTLDPLRRRALVRFLLGRTLRIVRQSRAASGCLVISRDPEVLQLARRAGAASLRETRPGLNAALKQAASRLRGTMLVLPVDLPLLDRLALAALLQPGPGRVAAIAPDRAGRGTNALLLQPPGLIECRFGADSFARHLDALRAAGVAPRIVKRRELGLDIDTPADLAAWRRRQV
jgi:2-phospho-L-lactate guanylyltransferase